MLHLLPQTGLYRPDPKSNLYSIAIHAGAVILLFALASSHPASDAVRKSIHLTDPILAPLSLPSHAGGGGGGRMLQLQSKGIFPPRSTRQFVPPQAVFINPLPKLTAQPTIIAPPDPTAPQVGVYGDPLGTLGIPSNGPGSGFGIGTGRGPGVGPGTGPAAGPGECCGAGGSGAFTPGMGGVTAPVIVYQIEPQYSEEARKAKVSGAVVLDFVVDAAGHPRDFHVVQGTGMGLDEKAIEAVGHWRFKPGTKAGNPVPVRARAVVNFRLL